MVDSQVPAFRDAYHFYYPQAVWLQYCADQGSYFPSWNFAEGLGVSVAGQPSAALYYPLRWLWWLPLLSVAQKFSLVVIVHLLIAAAGIQLAARRLGCTDWTSWLAAVSFSLSCPVFFQHTNLIYLCSAAWIGFALAAVFNVLRATNRRQYLCSCAVFGCAASLMLLAGDPQSAAHAFIVAGVIFAAEWVNSLTHRSVAPVQSPAPSLAAAVPCTVPAKKSFNGRRFWIATQCKLLGIQLLWLLGALGLVVVLGCIQWLPAVRWASHSGRVPAVVEHDGRVSPASIARASSGFTANSEASVAEVEPLSKISLTPAVDAVLGSTRSVLSHNYDFSLPPWHGLTCLWPTLGGHYLPNNSRLFAILPAEGRMWIPSLYFGCWPCLLFMAALFTRGSHLARALKMVAVLAVLAALGNYSIVWLLREVLSGVSLTTLASQLPKDHVGSLTWVLNGIVPGYSMFRYPGKWTVWIVAAASLLAAQYYAERSFKEDNLQRRLTSWLLGISLTGLLLSGCLAMACSWGYSLDAWLASKVADLWLGPPKTLAIAASLGIAFGVPSVLLGLSMFTWTGILDIKNDKNGRAANFQSQASSSCHKGRCLTLLTLAEMTLCASCWIQFLPAPNSDGSSDFSVPTDRHADQFGRPFVWSNRGQANLQRDHFVQSPQSYAGDQASYQRVWLTGKLGLLADVKCLHAAQSVDPRELVQLRAWLSRHDRQLVRQPEVDRVLRELGVTHRLVRSQPDLEPATVHHPDADGTIVNRATQPTQFAWQAIEDPLPLCQVLESRTATLSADSAVSWRWTRPERLVIQIAGKDVDYAEGSGSVGGDIDGERGGALGNAVVGGRVGGDFDAEGGDALGNAVVGGRVVGDFEAERRATLGNTLVVRQMNDGGWLARDASGRALTISREPRFVEIVLSDAVDEITLSRRWFW